jgi:hypothetical protein
MSLGTLLERPQPGRQPATLPPPARTQPPAAPPPSTRPGRPAPSRDLFVDLVRVGAVVVIVVLHWLMPVLDYADGTLTTANAFATGSAWAITWVSQVMPLIFFAGGAAAAISLPRRWARQRHTPATTASWVADRLRRLIVPVLPLAAVWLLVPAVLVAIGIPDQPVQVAAELVGRLLWFLGAYLVLVALTPVLLRLHDRFRGREVVVLALGAIAVDWLRFGWLDGAGWVGFLNVVLVWGAVYQVGVHYGRGRRWSAARSAAASAIGLVTVAAAVAFGPYPASMIGMPGEPVSNMNPPTGRRNRGQRADPQPVAGVTARSPPPRRPGGARHGPGPARARGWRAAAAAGPTTGRAVPRWLRGGPARPRCRARAGTPAPGGRAPPR